MTVSRTEKNLNIVLIEDGMLIKNYLRQLSALKFEGYDKVVVISFDSIENYYKYLSNLKESDPIPNLILFDNTLNGTVLDKDKDKKAVVLGLKAAKIECMTVEELEQEKKNLPIAKKKVEEFQEVDQAIKVLKKKIKELELTTEKTGLDELQRALEQEEKHIEELGEAIKKFSTYDGYDHLSFNYLNISLDTVLSNQIKTKQTVAKEGIPQQTLLFTDGQEKFAYVEDVATELTKVKPGVPESKAKAFFIPGKIISNIGVPIGIVKTFTLVEPKKPKPRKLTRQTSAPTLKNKKRANIPSSSSSIESTTFPVLQPPTRGSSAPETKRNETKDVEMSGNVHSRSDSSSQTTSTLSVLSGLSLTPIQIQPYQTDITPIAVQTPITATTSSTSDLDMSITPTPTSTPSTMMASPTEYQKPDNEMNTGELTPRKGFGNNSSS